ncbi:MAG: tRNA-guanine transglycosylase [Desulfobacterales bacterium]|nr:tRNA-guanine transglycosylase [Desulfobacterales bacterium]
MQTYLNSRTHKSFELPIFLPVYHPRESFIPIDTWPTEFNIQGCIVNAFFLYKQREIRNALKKGLTIRDIVKFPGLIMTDSGAFQGFHGRLFLENKTIVKFQEAIGADIISPLDIVTPPYDKKELAEKKLKTTLARVQEAIGVVQEGILAGVQQGGKFLDLRRSATEALLTMGVQYLALGSLVPFFNKNHELGFVGNVIRDARNMCGEGFPIHVYGAGDPVEIPFLIELGATIFDSSAYAHYARSGWYMTPFGAIQDAGPLISGEFSCSCRFCSQMNKPEDIFSDERSLEAHNLWTIMQTINQVIKAKQENSFHQLLEQILEQHMYWFPKSALHSSWSNLK